MATEIKNAITARDFASVVAIKRWMLDDKTRDEEMHLGTLIGTATGTGRKQGRTPDGEITESIVIEGRFRMFQALTGQFKEATACFLPKAFATMVEAGVAANNGAPIDFAVEIGARRRGEGDFLYTTKSMVENRAVDPFADLMRKAIASGARIPSLQLAAPEDPKEAGVVVEGEVISMGDASAVDEDDRPGPSELQREHEAEAPKGKGRHKAA